MTTPERPPLLDVDAADLGRHPDAIGRIHRRELLGVIVRNAFDPALLGAVVERLQRNDTTLVRHPSGSYSGCSFGRLLITHGADLADYFAESAAMPAGLRDLFGGDVMGQFEGIFARLTGGLPVRLAREPDGAPYTPLTLRELGPGGDLALHCENETFAFPSMGGLSAQLDPATIISFYLKAAVPEGGGELMLHHLAHAEGPGAALQHLRRDEAALAALLAAHGADALTTGVGDLLIFDSGRNYHRVSRVEGPRSRYTFGGFLGRARSGDSYLYWS